MINIAFAIFANAMLNRRRVISAICVLTGAGHISGWSRPGTRGAIVKNGPLWLQSGNCFVAIMGKPKDEADAKQMLQKLQGEEHSVYTGVTILVKENGAVQHVQTFSQETKVYVYEMTVEEIDRYIATGEPMDKAGAYGIQGRFAAYVDGIEGDYNNVVGLPVSAVWQELKELL